MTSRRAKILVPVGLLAAAAGALAWQYWKASERRAEEIRRIISDVDRETGKDRPDTSELGRLKLRIERVDDRASAPELALALAKIEFARGRFSMAWEALAPLATAGDAALDELRFGARILLVLHAQTGDRTLAVQCRTLASRAHDISGVVPDLFVAWQAAHRIGDSAAAEEIVRRLKSDHEGSKEAKLVELIESPPEDPTGETMRSAIAEVESAFAREPVELGLVRAVVQMKRGEILAARETLERLASRAPAVLDVRHLSAIACHLVAGSPDLPEAERRRARAERDAHLDYCIRHGQDDPRREQWLGLLRG
ncbi:MAG: hypothetical protein Fur0037_07950 [Planctomycetota bacterium]